MQLDLEPHDHEDGLQSVMSKADPGTGKAIKEARMLGVPWHKIIALMLQFGPQFMAMLKEMIDALKTDVPKPETVDVPEPHVEHHAKKGKKHAEE